MQSGGEATGYGEDGLATGVVGEDTGTGKREGHNRYGDSRQGDHQGQVKTAAVRASYDLGRLVALLRSPGV
jgi:hypothetical protein